MDLKWKSSFSGDLKHFHHLWRRSEVQIDLPLHSEVVKDEEERLSDDDYMFKHSAALRNRQRCLASDVGHAIMHRHVLKLWKHRKNHKPRAVKSSPIDSIDFTMYYPPEMFVGNHHSGDSCKDLITSINML